jgi:hypothetical protein
MGWKSLKQKWQEKAVKKRFKKTKEVSERAHMNEVTLMLEPIRGHY